MYFLTQVRPQQINWRYITYLNLSFCLSACEAGALADRPNAISILKYQLVKFSPD